MGFVSLSKGPYTVGDSAAFGIENPFGDASALIMWGSSLGSHHKVIQDFDTY